MAGCSGRQSGLTPAGREADQIANLFWWMLGGTAVIWMAVIGLAVYAVRVRPEIGVRKSNFLIVTCGAIVPTLVLTGLLAYGLSMLPRLVAPGPEGSLKIRVHGEMWWWRVHYPAPDGGTVELANEIRLPVGEPVTFLLESSNVIHSFWIPSIGGKRDLIPGRVNRLTLTPTKTGVFRGACAEYCGTSHAWMSFEVRVMERDEFSRWLEQQEQPAREPETELALKGREEFLANGCSACHTIRGTRANGVIGPDLTHVGSRLSLGAGILPPGTNSLAHWIADVDNIKPGVLMPHFGMLRREQLQALAAYLEGLK